MTVNNFLKTRKALMAMTPEEIEADVEIEGVQGDNDQSRLNVVLNTVEWVKTAHGCLDSYNQFDNAMLGKMADYVEKIKLLIGAEQFFSPPSDERPFFRRETKSFLSDSTATSKRERGRRKVTTHFCLLRQCAVHPKNG